MALSLVLIHYPFHHYLTCTYYATWLLLYLYILYYSPRKHFSATDKSSALYNVTDTLSIPIKIGLYRQVSIAIRKKYIENTVKSVNLQELLSIAEQITTQQYTYSVYTYQNSYTRLVGIPTGLTKDLVIRYLYNLIKWYMFRDLERIVKLRRNPPLKGTALVDKRELQKSSTLTSQG